MANEFGKFCRKLRIDQDELLKDMANKLEVTSAYLSAVENGKRRVPKDWAEKIAKCYALDSGQIQELNKSVECSIDEVSINLSKARNNGARSAAIAFARKFDSLSDDEISKIKNILNQRNED